MPTTPAPSQDRITADELRRAFESINTQIELLHDMNNCIRGDIEALTQTLNTIMQGISHAATATPPASMFGEMEISAIIYNVDKNDKPVYLAMGVPYAKYGVRIWDEILPLLNLDPATFKAGKNIINPGIRARVLLGETTNRDTKVKGIGPLKVTGKV